jgi:hypothetical protein
MCRRRCCKPTGWWPARRSPGPRVWPVTSAGVTPRRAARRWWCSITTRRVRPGRSSRWSRPSRRSRPASRSPTRGPAPSRPGDRRATTAATRRWRRWRAGWWPTCSRAGARCVWGWPMARSRRGWRRPGRRGRPPGRQGRWSCRPVAAPPSWRRCRSRCWTTPAPPVGASVVGLSRCTTWWACSSASGCGRWVIWRRCRWPRSWAGSGPPGGRPTGWRAGSTGGRRSPSRRPRI